MDAYRGPAQEPEAAVAVIGRRSVVSQGSAIAIHAALIAGVVWVIAVWAWPVWLAAIGVVLALSLIQDLHALSIPVEFALTGAGMRIRYSERTGGPWMRRVDQFVPWSEVRGVRVHELRSTGAVSTTLHIATASGTVSIEPGTFDAPAEELQTRILDHMHALGDAAAREDAGVDAFSRARWTTPLRLVLQRQVGPWVWMIALLWLPLAGLAYVAGSLWPVWLAIAGLYLVGPVSGLAAARKLRVLELRADGLALGSAPGRLTVIPWHEILLVRRHVVTSGARPETTALDVRLRDGRTLTLHGPYERTLDELAELLDPPVAKLALARASMAAGADIETASRAAGLPDRGPAAP